MIVTAIVLGIIAAIIDHFFGIAEPWRKIVYIGVIVLLVLGIVLLLVPGILPLRLGAY
jgi:cation transporter-like permease